MQDFVFMGIRFLTAKGSMVPPPDRIIRFGHGGSFCFAFFGF